MDVARSFYMPLTVHSFYARVYRFLLHKPSYRLILGDQ